MSGSPCDLPPDLFYKVIEHYNDPIKAIELIDLCDKMKDLKEDPIRLKQFIEYYEPMILDFEYDDFISLFNNEESLNNFWNSS